jgi:hypothetical protein
VEEKKSLILSEKLMRMKALLESGAITPFNPATKEQPHIFAEVWEYDVRPRGKRSKKGQNKDS